MGTLSTRDRRRTLSMHGALPESGETLMSTIKNFLAVRNQTGDKGWRTNEIDQCVQELRDGCNTAMRSIGQGVHPTVEDRASLIWTSPVKVLEACGSPQEFCFIMSQAFRANDKKALSELLPYIMLLNSTLVTRGQHTRHELWPKDKHGLPLRESFRGTGIPKGRIA